MSNGVNFLSAGNRPLCQIFSKRLYFSNIFGPDISTKHLLHSLRSLAFKKEGEFEGMSKVNYRPSSGHP